MARDIGLLIAFYLGRVISRLNHIPHRPISQTSTTGSEFALATLTSHIQELIGKHVGGTLTVASAMHPFANVPTTSSLLQNPDSSLIEADWDRP
ncbi:hypothetical protein FRX31_023865 [Thalictrum thalictroides]|uniref:Uncharacterized protein n=1 Tax=Thalictrum thalictroides TaxID=46969 RepID=A0A7J6VPR4_THATH|nr:hypothetical protein FRX31_023865 [Thalictrum thalictroides]